MIKIRKHGYRPSAIPQGVLGKRWIHISTTPSGASAPLRGPSAEPLVSPNNDAPGRHTTPSRSLRLTSRRCQVRGPRCTLFSSFCLVVSFPDFIHPTRDSSWSQWKSGECQFTTTSLSGQLRLTCTRQYQHFPCSRQFPEHCSEYRSFSKKYACLSSVGPRILSAYR